MGAAYDMAVILYRQKRYDLAREQFSRELAEQPNNANAFAMLALCLTAQDQFRPARQHAEQAIALEPSLAFGHYCLAWVFYKDQYFSCRRRFSFPRDPAALRRKRLTLAEATVHEAIRLNPRDVNYLGLLGWIRYEMKNYRGAAEAAEQGLAIDPSSNDCLRVQAYVLQARGQIGAAKKVSQTALSAHPENVLTHVVHGKSLLLAGDWRASLEHFREAMRLDPNSAAARTGLISGLSARNPVVRLLVVRQRASPLDRITHLGLLVLVSGSLLMLPFLAAALFTHAPVRFDLLILAATVPAVVFFLSPVWIVFLLQFDREGKNALTTVRRLRATTFLVAVTLGYSVLAFGGVLSSPPEAQVFQGALLVTSRVACVILLSRFISRGVISLRNSGRFHQ